MFNHILVPLDESALAECVLPHVVALALHASTRVSLLSVLDPHCIFGQVQPTDPLEWHLSKAELARYLEGVKQRLQAAGLDVAAEMHGGEAASSIIQFIRDRGVDLVVLSSHGRSGLSAASLGSVGQKTAFLANVAVMVVRAQSKGQTLEGLHYRKLLVPLDGSPRAECGLRVAGALARQHEAEFMLAHVVRRPEVPRRTPLSPVERELVERLVALNQQEGASYLEGHERRLKAEGWNVSTRLVVSDQVETALHDLVDREGVDLVVLSAHGYSGSTRWPFGSTVVNFITYGSSPLLIVQDLGVYEIAPSRAALMLKEHQGH